VNGSVLHYCCRDFARTLSKPFELTYDPYTQRVNVIDRPESIKRAVEDICSQLSLVSSALRKLRLSWNTRCAVASSAAGIKPRRHVGGLLNANNEWGQTRKCVNSSPRFCADCVSWLVYNSHVAVSKSTKFTTRHLQYCIPTTWWRQLYYRQNDVTVTACTVYSLEAWLQTRFQLWCFNSACQFTCILIVIGVLVMIFPWPQSACYRPCSKWLAMASRSFSVCKAVVVVSNRVLSTRR